jgi:pimeloyl-ACP methyl ester carboxylesterase/DNA-binding CsgD family transcriptional regulator
MMSEKARATMRQEIRYCTSSGGVRVAYATLGVGMPLVKTTSWLSHLDFEAQSPVWRHWLAELSRTHMLVRYDERGCGLSARNVNDFSLDAWVADLEAVVDTLGLERFPLLGICQGGSVAISYTVRHPDKVSHLLLFNCFAQGRLKDHTSPQQAELLSALVSLARNGWGEKNPAFRQVFTSLFVPGGTAEQTRWFNDLERVSTPPANAARFLDAFFRLDVRDIAPRVSVPTLVLHSRGDAVVPFKDGQELATLIPNARFVPLQTSNHVLLEDEPVWPQFVSELRDFIGVAPCFPELTSRERNVLDLIAQGLDNVEIATRLVISDKTVRNHITSIFSKLQVSNRAQAIIQAREAGMGRGS